MVHASGREHADPWWRWTKRAWLCYGIVLVVIAAYRARDPTRQGSDFSAFYRTAQALAEQGRIVADRGVFHYLPFFVVFFEPATVLPCWLACALFTAGSLVLAAAAVWISYRFLLPRRPAGPAMLIGLPALTLAPFVTACAVQGQVTLLMVFLLQLSWWLFAVRGRSVWAGLPLALAILIKPFLVSALALLAWKRALRTTVSCLVAIALLGAGLTYARLGRTEWLRAHQTYWQRVVAGYSPMVAAGKPADPDARYRNQSLPVVLKRLLSRVDAGSEGRPLFVNLMDWPTGRVVGLYVTLLAGLVAALGWTARRPLGRPVTDKWHHEYGVSVIAGFCISPIVWTHYFPLMLYPLMLLMAGLLADAADARRSRLGTFAWWIWAASSASLVIELFAPAYLRAAGAHLWASLLVGLALAWRGAEGRGEESRVPGARSEN